MNISNNRIMRALFVACVVTLTGVSVGQCDTDIASQLDALSSNSSTTIAAQRELKKKVTQNDAMAVEVQHLVIRQALADFQNEDLRHQFKRLRSESPKYGAVLALDIYYAKIPNKGRDSVIVTGRVVVEDGRFSAEAAQGQMQVREGGYFAGAVGDVNKPIGFAMQGYAPVLATGDRIQDNLLWLGDLRLSRDDPTVDRSFRGKLRILGDIAPTEVSASLYVAPPEINTPTNTYKGLASKKAEKLPEVTVSETGEISGTGFSPTKYWLYLAADGYDTRVAILDFSDNTAVDEGSIPMLCTDIRYYSKSEEPEARPIKWEESYDAAIEKARETKKPLLVMFTAEWCGPCKLLDATTLKDPWIEELLQPFVTVKLWEDHQREKVLMGSASIPYPTIAFIGLDGKPAHRFVGFMNTIPFAQECAKAYAELDITMPAGIQRILKIFEHAGENVK